MDERRIDAIARLLAGGVDRRRLAGRITVALLGGLTLSRSARAACKKVGKKCDKNQDCCDGAECKGGECKCRNGRDECDGNGTCANLNTDEAHCGVCTGVCGPNETCCDGLCVNLQRNRSHCGSCGASCLGDEICAGGHCADP